MDKVIKLFNKDAPDLFYKTTIRDALKHLEPEKKELSYGDLVRGTCIFNKYFNIRIKEVMEQFLGQVAFTIMPQYEENKNRCARLDYKKVLFLDFLYHLYESSGHEYIPVTYVQKKLPLTRDLNYFVSFFDKIEKSFDTTTVTVKIPADLAEGRKDYISYIAYLYHRIKPNFDVMAGGKYIPKESLETRLLSQRVADKYFGKKGTKIHELGIGQSITDYVHKERESEPLQTSHQRRQHPTRGVRRYRMPVDYRPEDDVDGDEEPPEPQPPGFYENYGAQP